jgi:hypothetical protein
MTMKKEANALHSECTIHLSLEQTVRGADASMDGWMDGLVDERRETSVPVIGADQ